MANTLNEFLTECEMFPYSRENYELVKEAAEINVLAMFIENQEYMAENAGAFEGLDSNYMMESASEDDVKQLDQKAGGKKEKWASRTRDLWKRMVKALKAFWNAIVARYDKMKNKADDVRKNLGRIKVTPEVAKSIQELVDKAVKQSGIPISDKQREGLKKLPKNITVINENSFKNKLAAATCNTTIDLVINNPGQFALAFSEKQLKELFKFVSNQKVLVADEGALKSVVDFIERCQTANLKKGISVSKDKAEMEDLIKYINEAEQKLSQDIGAFKNGENNKGVGDVTSLFSNIQTVTQNSIKLYTAVIRYQEIVLNGLDVIIKKAETVTAKSEPKEKEGSEE